MARARLVGNKISRSERVHSLPLPARLLYTWMITHLDREGRLSGNPKIVKQLVIPLTDYSLTTVDKWLDQMQALKDPETGYGLIERYEVAGKKYLWMPGFEGEQSSKGGQSWKGREAPSDLPPPPGAPAPVLGDTMKRAIESTDEILDPIFKAMVIDFEDNIAMLTPMLSERLIVIQGEYPEGWFTKAVSEAVTYGKRNLKYIERILERWKVEGLPTPEDRPVIKAGRGTVSHERIIDYKFD